MIPLLALALLAPPVPPPPAPALEAAIALWEEHPLSESYRQTTLDVMVLGATHRALEEAKVKTGDRHWSAKWERMRARLAAHVPADRRRLDREVTACLAEPLARNLDVEEIAEVRRFAATPAGARFWEVAVLRPDQVNACYAQALPIWPTDEDYRAAGIRPPKVKGYPGDVVS
jgi:hypothetical protein